ncbi:MAG: MaoC/PaaZ C-terminal domain-containing protein [Planctomycetota bacterium]
MSLLSEPDPTESQATETVREVSPQQSDSPDVDHSAAEMLFAEDLSVGDVWQTPYRRITGQDVESFADLTGDHTGLHGSEVASSPFGKPIAHGLLGLSVLAGLGASHPNASTLALVSIEDWRFLAPVFFGDSVRARNEISQITSHGRRAVKVRWTRQLLSEEGRVLQEGTFVTLVASRSRQKPR